MPDRERIRDDVTLGFDLSGCRGPRPQRALAVLIAPIWMSCSGDDATRGAAADTGAVDADLPGDVEAGAPAGSACTRDSLTNLINLSC
jgi:hypothetical protein